MYVVECFGKSGTLLMGHCMYHHLKRQLKVKRCFLCGESKACGNEGTVIGRASQQLVDIRDNETEKLGQKAKLCH